MTKLVCVIFQPSFNYIFQLFFKKCSNVKEIIFQSNTESVNRIENGNIIINILSFVSIEKNYK